MSRREGRDYDSKRHRSRFDREPSPKRPRRDGKPATERPSNNLNVDSGDHSDQDQKHRRRLQDALPLETPLAPGQKVEVGIVGEKSDKKSNGHNEETKYPSNPDKAPRSKSYFQQHDERGNARQVSRSYSRREDSDRGWRRDSKDQHSARETNRKTTNDSQQKDEKSHVRRDDNRAWRHDGFHKMETEAKPPARKRPAFREQKAPVEFGSVEKTVYDPLKPSQTDRPLLVSERKEEGGNNHRNLDRSEKPRAWGRVSNRNELERSNFSLRERYTGGGTYRGKEGFTGRQGYRPSGVRVEKWKHDLYDEANRSPTTKNEEDQIAKVEALLSS